MSDTYQTFRSAAKLRYRKMLLQHLRCLQLLSSGRPIPLGYWLALRSALGSLLLSEDPLLPPYTSLLSTGASLRISDLRMLIYNDLLGEWSLDEATISILWKRLLQERPTTILECGAGISTIVLAQYAELYGSQHPRRTTVYSLEQDSEIKQKVEQRLADLKLGKSVQILHIPVSTSGGYDVRTGGPLDQLAPGQADWVLIDGPSGPVGCRERILPDLSKYCGPATRWFLDDALRDGELHALRRWSQVPGILVEGIYPVGKGLGTGLMTGP